MSTQTRARADGAAGEMTPRPFRVTRRHQETGDTWTLELAPLSDVPIIAAPGQFTMVYAFGVGEVPLSVTGCDPAMGDESVAGDDSVAAGTDSPLVHTVRAVGAVTEAICASRPGDVLGVRGPFGRGWPVGAAAGLDVVVVAGGLGLAPLRPVVRQILRRRADYGNVVVLVGTRTPADILYRRELAGWQDRTDLQALVTVDGARPGWDGRVGVVTTLLPHVRFDPARTVAFTCGPEIMMRLTARALVDAGVLADRIHLSMERNMHCGLGHCGRCQLGPLMLCLDGPVCGYDRLEPLLAVREL
ncbi:FAD/NAD(P)-binding protein [Frankia sp. CeD]|uniref:FAD/NAD(P)-binding protein n=1 Tax=Frankia sp. CeD TaxID=258230 RepID=UPI0004DD762D|nr:FAD/NAD(P)-binding protein [Frankia sp. CeD]KEZ37766.1 2-polyprenylphenol hydroxylase-like oxidoreductase [Frankia sp. CeD]